MTYTHELHEAIAAAELAGRFAMDEYVRFTPIPNAPAEISTHVDRGAQELILKHLREKFPDDGILAEEKTPTALDAPADAARTWIVDPIDGTRGFAMKNGEFCVMVALVVDHLPVVGVVLEPVVGRLTYAAKGEGCFTRMLDGPPAKCSVSSVATPEEATMVVSHRKPGKPLRGPMAAVGAGRLVETYSAGIKLGMVARGEVELYLNEYAGFFDWDVAPGHVLVEEAGGRLTVLDGSPVRYGVPQTRDGMLASNGKVHAEVLRRLKST